MRRAYVSIAGITEIHGAGEMTYRNRQRLLLGIALLWLAVLALNLPPLVWIQDIVFNRTGIKVYFAAFFITLSIFMVFISSDLVAFKNCHPKVFRGLAIGVVCFVGFVGLYSQGVDLLPSPWPMYIKVVAGFLGMVFAIVALLPDTVSTRAARRICTIKRKTARGKAS